MLKVADDMARAVARICGQFSLDWVIDAGGLFGGEVLLGVAFMTLLRSNIRDLKTDPELNSLPAAEGPPRTPISGRALAEALSISRETCRRHLVRLTDMGLCERTAAGLVVPPGVLERPEIRAVATKAMDRLDWMFLHLAEIAKEPADERLLRTNEPMGLMISCDYVLRWAEMMSRDGIRFSPLTLVYNVILQGNIGHLIDDPVLRERYASEPPPDELRRPVPAREVARVLGGSRETVRAQVRAVESAGYATRVKGGMIVPRHQFFYEENLAVHRSELANLRRMLNQLREAGLLVAA